MGERKGQNKYYPPDFDYKIHKSLSGYHGQHALRERARKLDQGILIIRFEMPYNIWCDGCNNHVGMGVRYNAEKSKIGYYYSTPIFKFRMKCHLCSNHYEIKTDPANHDYVIISGAKRKEQRWDPHENEQIVPEDRDNQKKLVLDSMYKLEHSSNDQSKIKAAIPRLAQIIEQKSVYKDDFALNQLARKQFREAKRAAKSSAMKDEELKKKLSLSINLLPESQKDVNTAKLMKLSSTIGFQEIEMKKRKSIEEHLLFGSNEQTSNNPQKDLTAKEISLKKIQQIVSSSKKRKRSEAFSLNLKRPMINKIFPSSNNKPCKKLKCDRETEAAQNGDKSSSSSPPSTSELVVTTSSSDINGLSRLISSYDSSASSSSEDV